MNSTTKHSIPYKLAVPLINIVFDACISNDNGNCSLKVNPHFKIVHGTIGNTMVSNILGMLTTIDTIHIPYLSYLMVICYIATVFNGPVELTRVIPHKYQKSHGDLP